MAIGATSLQFHNVFVYGTLMADEVVNVLLNRVPPCSPAVLQGYRRHSIRGRVYPAIVPAENNSVNGKVIRDLTDYEMDLFDEFEDVEYVRTLEEVIVLGNETQQNGSDQLKAHTYVWADANDENLYGEWNFKEWKDVHMNDFLKMCESFIADFKELRVTRRVPIYETFFEHKP
uniref:Putative gamma-glutamylcyclotransferase n=1 Tax=Araucaria cunninghamii TaxID=56994 RepID=A0A0D6R6Z4_ARACU